MNKSGMKAVFQELLYKEPLYQLIGKQERNMNLLVLGGDEAALAFVDQCLQAGPDDLACFEYYGSDAKCVSG